jgi:hypothetical protein
MIDMGFLFNLTSYFWWKHTLIPIIFFTLIYLNKRGINLRYNVWVLLLLYLSLFSITGYIGLIYWGTTHLLGYLILIKKYPSSYSMNLSFMLVNSFSWLYELFWYHPLSMFFDSYSIFIINSGFFSSFASLYLLYGKIRLSGLVLTGLVFFVIWGLIHRFIILSDFYHDTVMVLGSYLVNYTTRIGGVLCVLFICNEVY